MLELIKNVLDEKNINYYMNLISLITIIIAAIWALFQYHKNMIIRKKEKASEILKEYYTNILENISIIMRVILMSPLCKYILDEDIKKFNIEEIEQIYGNEAIYNYNNEKNKIAKQLDLLYHLIVYYDNVPYNYEKFEEYRKDIFNK